MSIVYTQPPNRHYTNAAGCCGIATIVCVLILLVTAALEWHEGMATDEFGPVFVLVLIATLAFFASTVIFRFIAALRREY